MGSQTWLKTETLRSPVACIPLLPAIVPVLPGVVVAEPVGFGPEPVGWPARTIARNIRPSDKLPAGE